MRTEKIISRALEKSTEAINKLLIEAFPDCAETINFAAKENFKEWAAMLFELRKWKMSPKKLILSEIKIIPSKEKEVLKELSTYKDLEDLSNISVVKLPDDTLHLLDGYHRFFLAKSRGIEALKGVVWEKSTNKHPSADKVRKELIYNI